MAKIQTLKSPTGATIYPLTSSKAVIDPQGRDMETRFAAEREQTDNALKDYATKTELTEGLAAKQDALTDSEDVTVSNTQLLLTDKAKMRSFDKAWEAIGGTVVASGTAYSINGGNGTFDDAVKAMSYYSERPQKDMSGLCFGKTLKLLPRFIAQNAAEIKLNNAFQSLYGIDKVVIKSTLDGGKILVGDLFAAFNSSMVKELDCILDISRAKNVTTAFVYCAMEEIRLHGLACDVSFHFAGKLSLGSIQYMVANAANTTSITITVHPDVYAKLTYESNAEWHKVLTDALAKNISFATI